MLLLFKFALLSIGIFVLILFILSRGKSLSFKLLGLHYAILLYLVFNLLLFESGYITSFPHALRVAGPLGYLVGPLSFLFIRTLLYNESKLKKSDIWHCIPFLIHFLDSIPFYILGTTYKINLATEIAKGWPYKEMLEVGNTPAWTVLHFFLKFISVTGYFLYSYRMFKKFKKQAPEYVLIENYRLLKYANLFIQFKFLQFFTVLAASIILAFYNTPALAKLMIDFSMFIVLFFNIYLFVSIPNLLYGFQYSFAYNNDNHGDTSGEVYKKGMLFSSYNKSAKEIVVFIDTHFSIVHFNNIAAKITKALQGIEIEIGDDVRKFLPADLEPVFLEGFNKALNGQTFTKEILLRLNSRSKESWRLLELYPIYPEKGGLLGIMVTLKDISSNKINEMKVSEYQSKLNELAWRDSHVLRAPIASLLGLSRLLLKNEENLTMDEKILLVKNVHSEVERLDSIIKEFVESHE